MLACPSFILARALSLGIPLASTGGTLLSLSAHPIAPYLALHAIPIRKFAHTNGQLLRPRGAAFVEAVALSSLAAHPLIHSLAHLITHPSPLSSSHPLRLLRPARHHPLGPRMLPTAHTSEFIGNLLSQSGRDHIDKLSLGPAPSKPTKPSKCTHRFLPAPVCTPADAFNTAPSGTLWANKHPS